MHEKISDLNALRIFVKVVEKKSFTAAAVSLQTSQSIVSKCIKSLEADLGAKLILRSSRQFSLTDVGQDFYSNCRHILDEIGDGIRSAQHLNSEVSGDLRILSTLGVGPNLVFPAIMSFMRDNRSIAIDFVLAGRSNMVDLNYDVAIRMTNEVDPVLHNTSMDFRHLARFRHVACCSPAYIEGAGMPKEPSDLNNHTWLLHSGKARQSIWHFDGPNGRYSVHPSGTFSSNNSVTTLNATLAGFGIGLFLEPIVTDHIKAGRLISLFADELRAVRTLTAIFPRAQPLPKKLQLLLDYLQSYFSNASQSIVSKTT